MSDITYCVNDGCKFKDCDRHSCHIPKSQKYVSFANLDSVCERYLRSLFKEVQEDIKKESNSKEK